MKSIFSKLITTIICGALALAGFCCLNNAEELFHSDNNPDFYENVDFSKNERIELSDNDAANAKFLCDSKGKMMVNSQQNRIPTTIRTVNFSCPTRNLATNRTNNFPSPHSSESTWHSSNLFSPSHNLHILQKLSI